MNRFAPLTLQEIASAAIAHDAPDKDAAVCIMPVPHDAPPLPQKHWALGQPSMRWSYHGADGLLYEVWRFDPSGERKQFYPLTLWRAANGRVEWSWKAPPMPRPLYGLDRLAANPDAPVVVCKGEKSADAAARVFVDHVAITSPGGSQAASKAGWSPLSGRRALLWPDADEPGSKYAAEVAAILSGLGCEVSIINADALASLTPEGGNREPTKGWDAADAVKEWEDLEALREAAANHTNSFAADEGAADDDEFGREIARLAALSKVHYERERTAAATKLHVRAAFLDKWKRGGHMTNQRQARAASLN